LPTTARVYPLSLHDALPICKVGLLVGADVGRSLAPIKDELDLAVFARGLAAVLDGSKPLLDEGELARVRESFGKRVQERMRAERDRKSTRLNSSHVKISYAV